MAFSLWQLIAWGFWGGLAVLLSTSSLRQSAVGVTLLLLAVLNPVTAIALFARGSLVTWSSVLAVQVVNVVAALLFFSGSQPNWSVLVTPVVTAILLVVAFPRRVPA